MKKVFMVSLVMNGLLGGAIVSGEEAITYNTGKLTVPQEYRHLEMRYEDISGVTMGWLLFLPILTVKMRNEKEYKFVMFFSRKRLIDLLVEKGVNA